MVATRPGLPKPRLRAISRTCVNAPLVGGKESQVTRRNQSRRDGTICSPARECRVGFTQIESRRDDIMGFSRKLFSP
jgi:hypothetical protein